MWEELHFPAALAAGKVGPNYSSQRSLQRGAGSQGGAREAGRRGPSGLLFPGSGVHLFTPAASAARRRSRRLSGHAGAGHGGAGLTAGQAGEAAAETAAWVPGGGRSRRWETQGLR